MQPTDKNFPVKGMDLSFNEDDFISLEEISKIVRPQLANNEESYERYRNFKNSLIAKIKHAISKQETAKKVESSEV